MKKLLLSIIWVAGIILTASKGAGWMVEYLIVSWIIASRIEERK